ncbi:MAG: 23S rRNA (uracil(1939)-C(5))-methyltransferase RlmD, partial [Clostridiales bacterium]|nr:23S rRNA (uracil(1939)-C(5))-methyltransferase RlmD [Clostridiales bacterium]
MKKNDKIELTITDMGEGGEGIGHSEGMAFFVKDAVIGDEITATVTKLKKNYGFARLEKITAPSPYRTEPPCPESRRCGGCQLMPLSYGKQLEYKQNKVKNSLARIGGFSEETIDSCMTPIVGMDEPYRYRDKAQFPVGIAADGRHVVMGFYAARSHSIIPIDDCLIGAPENKSILSTIKNWMEDYGIRPYDEQTGEGLVRHVLIRNAASTGEFMACLVINGDKLPQQERLIGRLSAISGMACISINKNKKNTNVNLGNVTENIWGRAFITDKIHVLKYKDTGDDEIIKSRFNFLQTGVEVTFRISPQSFYQINPSQMEKLYSVALSFAGLSGNEIVWDVYCGIGTISLIFAKFCKFAYGIEAVPQAVKDARENAKLNGIKNVKFFAGKAEEILPGARVLDPNPEEADDSENYHGDNKPAVVKIPSPDVVVVDPPRKGCDAGCLSAILQANPKRIVYVSCDPATLARDLRILSDGGYRLRKIC